MAIKAAYPDADLRNILTGIKGSHNPSNCEEWLRRTKNLGLWDRYTKGAIQKALAKADPQTDWNNNGNACEDWI